MNSASSARLGDLTEPERSITYGVVKPGPEQDDGVLFVRGGDVFDGRIALDALRTITPSVSAEYKRTLLRGGELLVSLVGNPGEVAIAPDSLAGANIARQVGLIALRSEINTRYVMYYLMSPHGRADLFVQTGGAVQQVINLADLKRVVVPLPSRQSQDCIADILSAYDNLIENNGRRMALLEAAVRQLYREWFIRLRFPGHEHTLITHGVPTRWHHHHIEELVSLTIGGGWGSDDHATKFTEPAFVIRGTDLPDLKSGYFGRVPFRFHEPRNLASRELQPGDIILEISNGNIRNIGRSYRIESKILQSFDGKVMCASFCRLLRPSGETESYILASHFEEMQFNGRMDFFKTPSAAGINNFRFTALLKEERVLIPPRGLRDEFASQARNLRTQLANLAVQNHRLRTARDLLLPRLMSGAIPV